MGTRKTYRTKDVLFALTTALVVLLWAATVCGIVYVVIHFIEKLW